MPPIGRFCCKSRLRPMDARQLFGTKRTSCNVRSLVAIGGKRTRRLRAPTSEFDPTRTLTLFWSNTAPTHRGVKMLI